MSDDSVLRPRGRLEGRSPRDGLHCGLRNATQQQHRLIDQMMSSFDLTERADYGAFLNVHYIALRRLATRWRIEDQPDFEALLQCLRNDLQSLGIGVDDGVVCRPVSSSLRQWGVGYVIRGSRLGSTILRRRVASQFPTSYVDFSLSTSWPAFLSELEREGNTPNARGQIIRGAKLAFREFATATHDPALAGLS